MATAADKVAEWRSTNEQLSKTEFLKEFHALELKARKLEKDRNAFLHARRIEVGKGNNVQFFEMDSNFATSRLSDKGKLRLEIRKIHDLVHNFKQEVKSESRPTPQFVELIKAKMEEIESCISEFKERQKEKFDESLREERVLTQECALLERKIEAWATGGGEEGKETSNSGQKARALSTGRDITRDLPEEVAAFERFLIQTGGRLGGWDELDHQTFLRVRQKFRGREAFIDELICVLPTRTPTQMREHESWYCEFLALRDQKKEAIQRWKAAKAVASARTDATSDQEEEDDEEGKEEARRRRAEKEERERQEKQEQLEAWRFKKELEKQQVATRRLEEERAARRAEEKRVRAQEAKRAEVAAFRAARAQQEEEAEALAAWREWEEREAARKDVEQHSARIRDRNERFVQEKMSARKAKEDEEKAKAKRLERMKAQVEVRVQRDPNRLLRPTAGWEERLRNIGPEGGGPVLQMQHRAIPTWRQGL